MLLLSSERTTREVEERRATSDGTRDDPFRGAGEPRGETRGTRRETAETFFFSSFKEKIRRLAASNMMGELTVLGVISYVAWSIDRA